MPQRALYLDSLDDYFIAPSVISFKQLSHPKALENGWEKSEGASTLGIETVKCFVLVCVRQYENVEIIDPIIQILVTRENTRAAENTTVSHKYYTFIEPSIFLRSTMLSISELCGSGMGVNRRPNIFVDNFCNRDRSCAFLGSFHFSMITMMEVITTLATATGTKTQTGVVPFVLSQDFM